MEKRICKRCLLRDMDEGEILKDVRKAVEKLKPGERAEEAVTEERLNKCRQCQELTDGMCRLCGCYVEFRSALKTGRCPHIPTKW